MRKPVPGGAVMRSTVNLRLFASYRTDAQNAASRNPIILALAAHTALRIFSF